MSIKLKDLLRFRNVWLGCAMVWIVLAHSGFKFPSELFTTIKAWGYGGVDICLFASGIGCYFSLEKDPDLLRFWKRRISRLAPTYLPFILVWCLCRTMTQGLSLPSFLGNLLGIQALTTLGSSFNWYISALLLCYLLAPYLKMLADRLSTSGHSAIMVLLLLLSVPFWTDDNYIIAVTRFPIFYAGILFARHCHGGAQLSIKALFLFLAATVLGFLFLSVSYTRFSDYLWSYGLHWYPFLLITPGLCILISLACTILEKHHISRLFLKPLETVGRNSFEVYLVHAMLFEYLTPVHKSIPIPRNLLWALSLAAVAVGCLLLKVAAKACTKLLFSPKN